MSNNKKKTGALLSVYDRVYFLESCVNNIEQMLSELPDEDNMPYDSFLAYLSDLIYVACQLLRRQYNLPYNKDYQNSLYFPKSLDTYKKIIKTALDKSF